MVWPLSWQGDVWNMWKNKYTLRQNLYNNTKNLNIELKIELPWRYAVLKDFW